MSSRNWIILAVVIIVLVIGYLSLGGGTDATAPAAEPAAAEEPAPSN